METVQQSVVHLEHSGMPSQAQMAYAQRTTALHSRAANHTGEASSYKPQRPPAAPPSPAQFSNYPPAHPPNSMRYVQQQPPYGGAVPYRDNPYTVRTPVVVNDRQPAVEFVRNDLAPQVRPRLSLLTSMPPTDYLSALPRNRIPPPQGEPYRDRERDRTIDLASPSTRSEVYRERERDRDCVVVPPNASQASSLPDLGPAVKKIRLGEPKPELQQQLRIETRPEPSQQAYTPQVEAISPTLPTDGVAEDANFRSTKDDLLQQISKVDREISKVEGSIAKLKKKEQELEEAACQPNDKKDEEEERAQQPKHQSLAQKIYAENRRKAQKAHLEFVKLGPKVELPLYNQPSDTAVYEENKRKHAAFKKRLYDHLRSKRLERENREKLMTQTYSRLAQEWARKVDKIENSAKRKAKDAKYRDFFEKVFPELRKQREDRERFNRVGARIKSEADLEEIMDSLQEQEMEEKKMHAYAVIPPLVLDPDQRRYAYINKNGKIEDYASEYKERQLLNVWTKAEIDIFKEKFLQHPKSFGVIASYLDRKSASDCVSYYYHSKKEANYKRLLRKSRQRTRSSRNPNSKVANASAGASTSGAPNDSMDSLLSTTTGVTTRLQREQLQKQEHPHPLPQHPPAAAPTHPVCDNLNVEPSGDKDNDPSPPHLEMAVTPPPPAACEPDTPADLQQPSTSTAQMPPALPAPAPAAPSSGEVKLDSKKKERRKEEKKKKEEELEETTDEELLPDAQDGERGAQLCFVCNVESEQTRSLPRSQASQYGLREENVVAGARVCNTCRCKLVRSRNLTCPLPTCPNNKTHRVKRLRSLPAKWNELTHSAKETIMSELQLNPEMTKVCSACYNRISRKISQQVGENASASDMNAASPGSQLLRWSEEEQEALKRGIREHGSKWSDVSQYISALGSTKTSHQCKTFFFNYKKKFGLDLILQEYNRTHLGEERKPSLTDEEESGSSTSSCEETGLGMMADSDTASAGSPSQAAEPSGGLKEAGEERKEDTSVSTEQDSGPPTLVAQKEDYDSSATETADEGQGAGDAEGRGAPPPSSSPLTVKDIMLNVIEMQLMKNPNSVGATGPAPTISSILKTEHSHGFVKANNSLATLSVVTPGSGSPLPELQKENLVSVQLQPVASRDRETEGTLDLSIKKPRIEYSQAQAKHSPLAPPHSATVYRTASTHTDSNYYHQVASPQLTSKLSPKLSPGLMGTGVGVGGSILHGTPVSSPSFHPGSGAQQLPPASRFDTSPLLRQMTPPHAPKEASAGSITQGTPVHQRGIYQGSGSNEYFSANSGSGGAGGKRPAPTAQGFYPPRTPQYAVEQRQIIMNDYITSQQMHGTAARRTNDKTTLYYQPRQGVIQRHNTKPPSPAPAPHHYPPAHKPPSPHHYPPGHEAFSSLVDVAVRQPSLPVPQGLQDHKEDKRLLHEGLGERFNRDNAKERFVGREQERFARENHQIHHRSIADNHHQSQQASRDIHQSQQIREHQIHQPIHHHQRDLERERSHLQQQQQLREREHQLLREQQLHHQQLAIATQQQHQRDLLHQKQQQQQQIQQLRENHLQQLHNHQQQQQQAAAAQQQREREREREADHHRLGRIQQLTVGYPGQREEQARMMQFSREQPPASRPHPDTSGSREGNSSGGGGGAGGGSGGAGGGNRGSSGTGRQGDSSTLTAASLIDAIITHQINQTSSESQTGQGNPGNNAPQQQVTRPSDRLFQGFHRDGPEANGKLSPLKTGGLPVAGSPDSKQGAISLGDHIESIINKDYPPTSRHSQFQGYEPQAWKLRRALQQKELDQNQALREKNDERNIVRMAGPPSPSSRGRYYEPPAVPLSPLDYVKNRIVEVMRTSEEEGGSKSGGGESPGAGDMVIDEGEEQSSTGSTAPPFIATSATYTYPYSALSLNTAAPQVPVSVPSSKPLTTSEPVPEPAPLLSAQYEPLSDED